MVGLALQEPLDLGPGLAEVVLFPQRLRQTSLVVEYPGKRSSPWRQSATASSTRPARRYASASAANAWELGSRASRAS
jgi:hypothetical protein